MSQQQIASGQPGQPPVIFDEYGRPFVILRDQQEKKKVSGLEALRQNILAAVSVATTLRTSLGPKGADKMLVSPDGDLNISNDGATIMEQMQVEHEVAKLLVELSRSQDAEIGDGTTSVVVFAGALLEQALELLNRGMHPVRVAAGYEKAAQICSAYLREISDELKMEEDLRSHLIKTAKTTLSSKIVCKDIEKMASIAVDAVLSVADLTRRDTNLDLIKVVTKTGGRIEDTMLVQGIVAEKEFSHPQMPKKVTDAKIAILTCPMEAPKPKNKHHIDIVDADAYERLATMEHDYFAKMIESLKEVGCNFVVCQWGFEDEANHLLLKNGINALRWVSGPEIELLAIATGARIVPRFEDLSADKLGSAASIKEVALGTTRDRFVFFEGCPSSRAVTVVCRGSNNMAVAETQRSLHDAICVARNLIRDPAIIYGGGSAEIACAIKINEHADTVTNTEQFAYRAFADALEAIPMALAENAGLDVLETVASLRTQQMKENKSDYGVDCNGTGDNDMKAQHVFETLKGKQQQLLLATQVTKMILRIDTNLEL
ncbi:hypothetical protein GEMRC1_003395 [Eukaryota sp. GEM-RC1]